MKNYKKLSIVLATSAVLVTGCGNSHKKNDVPPMPTNTSSGVVGNEKPDNSNKPTQSPKTAKDDKAATAKVTKSSATQKLNTLNKAPATMDATTKRLLDEKNKQAQQNQRAKNNGEYHYPYDYNKVRGNENIGANPFPKNSVKFDITKTPVSTVGRPVAVSIPSIGVYQYLSRVGIRNGVLSPSPGHASWYTGSVKPGDNGISKILGHVTYYGPDVFYNLSRVPIGANVNVYYSGGGHKTFKVYNKASINKNSLQTDRRIWGKSKTPVLALITCDRRSAWQGPHHVNNYVLWAK